MKPYRGPLTTLGNAATAKVRLIVWCRDCQRRIEPDPAEHAARYGATRVQQAILVRHHTRRDRRNINAAVLG